MQRQVAIEWLDDDLAFNALEPEWNTLAASASPFVTHAWIMAWYTAFGQGQVRACVARREGSLVAALPLIERRNSLVSPTNAHSPSFQPLGDEDDVACVLREVVMRDPTAFALEHVPGSDPVVARLTHVSSEHRRRTWVEPGRRSPIVDTTGDYRSYLSGRSRHVSRELPRLRRKLETEHRTVLTAFGCPVDVEAELQEMLALEASGWKHRRGTAILQSRDTTAFYRDVAASWAAAGQLRISSIRVDGALVAADLCVVSHGRAWIPKGAYDERFARYSPGRVLLLAEIEEAFALGLEAVELLGDADPYKLGFCTSERQLCTVHSFSRRALPFARIGYRRSVRPRIRQIYRSIRA